MMRERSSAEETLKEFERVENEARDLLELLELAASERDEGVVADIAEQLDSHFAYMESIIRPSGHFVLDDLSAADIMLSFPAQIAMRMDRRAKYPKLAAFVDAMEARPAYQRAVEKGGV